MKNLTQLFKIYTAYCEQNKTKCVKEKLFLDIFNTKILYKCIQCIQALKIGICKTCEKMKNIQNKSEDKKIRFQKRIENNVNSKNLHLKGKKDQK